jgi:exodeoxyribonuclease V alpha subunit
MNEIFRQSEESLIIVNSHRVNHGELPIVRGSADEADFRFIECKRPEDALSEILELVGKALPNARQLDPMSDIQVITPMHKGVIGVENLNRTLQGLLNPNGLEFVREGKRFRTGDKVMQMRNNYDKDVFNGDMGRILRMDPEGGEVMTEFYGRQIRYELNELDEITPAYAITVHKSQGSEYPAVIIPVFTEHYMLLQRNLLYTAITRGRDLVIILGSRRALSLAVRNEKTQQRYTGLERRLRGH